MKGNVRNLWECRHGGKTASLEKDGRLWYVRIKAGDEILTEQSYRTIGHAHAAFDEAANSVSGLSEEK